MAFILIPRNGEDISVNAWNWRPTLEVLKSAHLIDDDLYARMGTHGREARIDLDTASRIADLLDERLRKLKPGDRIRYDLTLTDKPKERLAITPGTESGHIDVVEMYSATYEWLTAFRDFCRTSGGFQVS